MTDTGRYCPRCHAPVAWRGNPHRPFCSARCQMVDLGRWLAEDYRIPEAPATGDAPSPADGAADETH